MKQIVKIALIFVFLFTVTAMAQEEEKTTTGLSAANYSRALTNYISSGYNNDPQEYFQAFGYYNNPEIQKLEDEVEMLSHLYSLDRWDKNGFSSDKYASLTGDEKKLVKDLFGNFGYRLLAYSGNRKSDKEKEKASDVKMEEFYNKTVAQYLTGDKEKTVNKPKLLDEIKKRLDQLFEMKENEKQKEVAKLEQQLKSLQSTLAERKKNKTQIIDQRLNELIGLPNTLRW